MWSDLSLIHQTKDTLFGRFRSKNLEAEVWFSDLSSHCPNGGPGRPRKNGTMLRISQNLQSLKLIHDHDCQRQVMFLWIDNVAWSPSTNDRSEAFGKEGSPLWHYTLNSPLSSGRWLDFWRKFNKAVNLKNQPWAHGMNIIVRNLYGMNILGSWRTWCSVSHEEILAAIGQQRPRELKGQALSSTFPYVMMEGIVIELWENVGHLILRVAAMENKCFQLGRILHSGCKFSQTGIPVSRVTRPLRKNSFMHNSHVSKSFCCTFAQRHSLLFISFIF